MFCVECGKEGVALYGGACMECFLKGRQLAKLPHHVDLQVCTSCNEYMLGGAWTKIRRADACGEAALEHLEIIPEARLESVGIKSQQQDERSYQTYIQVDLDVDGTPAGAEVSTNVRVKHTVCQLCSRKLGSYYVSIVQVRSGGKNPDEKLLSEISAKVGSYVASHGNNNRDTFISKEERVPGGIDFKLSSNSLGRSVARLIADTYGAETKESSSLVGVHSDGSDMYRVTFLARLPGYAVGDIALRDGKIYKISAVSKSGGKITNLTNFREESVRKSDLQDLKILMKASEVQEATVVSRSKGEIQVLHPSTYATVDVAVPSDAEIGETVPVVEASGSIYYVP